jgi:hypothetical protein
MMAVLQKLQEASGTPKSLLSQPPFQPEEPQASHDEFLTPTMPDVAVAAPTAVAATAAITPAVTAPPMAAVAPMPVVEVLRRGRGKRHTIGPVGLCRKSA